MNDYLKFAQFELQTHDRLRLREWWSDETAGGGNFVLYAAIDGSPAYALVQRLASMPPDERASRFQESHYIGALVDEAGVAGNGHEFIQVVAFDIPEAWREEIDAWYDEEHMSLLLRADGWLRALRMSVLVCRGRPFTSVAIHELRDLAVMDSPERAAARATAWREKFSREPWFVGSGRWLYRRLTIQ